ncbi:LOW QUALITY PROTEIN: interleukin-20 receptor subunit beta [Erinaceus europaeus]|uniref:LOW QUALITY PROTEIN: interleukin-20 receptor subunit beta n=1 Tax=Erinaceus europaeus TaxID=9365 RepID=A0A1S2ZMZ6_ERIEU|nr:LOW QUALITY PROTEIN: interleukin-20 receptor subunit beta [Erinaceus europaeus]
MVLEEISASLILWLFYTLIPSLHSDRVAILPAPQNLSVQSINMKHLLMWIPVSVAEKGLYYTVEYQGEYECLYRSDTCIPSSWCSPTPNPECDITVTVSYSLRVWATVGSQSSAWSTLKYLFSRNSTILTAPGMQVTMDGLHLLVVLEDLGPQFEFLVASWRREPGTKEYATLVPTGGVPMLLETMEPGTTYCVKAQAFVKAIGRYSAFSQVKCVKAPGEALPQVLALLAFVSFMLLLVVVPLSLWKVGQLIRYSCCPAVRLPDTLEVTSFPQKLISCGKEEETCVVWILPSEAPSRELNLTDREPAQWRLRPWTPGSSSPEGKTLCAPPGTQGEGRKKRAAPSAWQTMGI